MTFKGKKQTKQTKQVPINKTVSMFFHIFLK